MTPSAKRFGFCLNTSTIRGQNLSLPEMIDLTASCGYDGIEPWIREIDAYVQGGGRIQDLRKRIEDAGLVVPNLIGFFPWGVDDEAQRREGLEEARRNLDQAVAIGATGLAAAPMGLTDKTGMDLRVLAERFAAVIDLAGGSGVRPILEFWGMSKTLGTLGEALMVAAECGCRAATILADVFHMYKGSGSFEGLSLLGPSTLGLMHLNDYPAEPTRDQAKDSDRVYPGDGIAPLDRILSDLLRAGYKGMLSLELFNQDYYARGAQDVAATGLKKMRAAVDSSCDQGPLP
jgi:sugar phosphate isomerase/epimerase